MGETTIEMLAAELDRLAIDTGFSGAYRVDDGDNTIVAAHGLADRRFAIPNETSTRFAVASGAKGITALVVLSLIEDGTLGFDTTARPILGDDLQLIDDRVGRIVSSTTVESSTRCRRSTGSATDWGSGCLRPARRYSSKAVMWGSRSGRPTIANAAVPSP